jgi:hypothetical protein
MRIWAVFLIAFLTAAPLWAGISYQDVLASPDDPGINFLYAKNRAAAGDVLAALAALERVLSVAPGHAPSHLLMASLLARAGRPQEAEEELVRLDSQPFPLAVREAARHLRGRLAGPSRLSLDGTVGVGGEWSSNANFASRTGQALLFGAPVSLSPGSQRREDTALLTFARLDGRLALGPSRRASLLGGFSHYRIDHRDLPNRDLAGLSGRLGAACRFGPAEASVQATLDHLVLDRSTFLRSPGAAARLSGKLGARAAAWMEGRGVYEDFARPAAAPASPARSGPRWDASVGADWGRGPGLSLQGSYHHAEKHAASDVNSFLRDGFTGSLSWEFPGGAAVRANAGVDFDAYAKADPVVSARRRRDVIGRYGASLGAPLGVLHRVLAAAAVTTSFERLESASSLLTYSFTEDRVSLVGSWRWSYP